jgi:radical SAM enzyme (TIGR01210 family)
MFRGAKAALDPARAYAAVFEQERDASGALAPTAVVFITNKECPFRCVMCDLWVNTLDARIAPALVPGQIAAALASLPPARQVKLYNAGSFFDPDAIPPEDDEAIAAIVGRMDRVIVEAHPAFLTGVHGERCLRFRDRLDGALEVAIGLETAHPGVLRDLNKGMTVETFQRAADFLGEHGIALRVFVLLRPPTMTEAQGVEWACRSIDVAAACGATACSVIPTRGGEQPSVRSLERAIEYGLAVRDASGGMRVFADLWDIERFFDCTCSRDRAARLRAMNRTQRIEPAVECRCAA